MTARHLEATTPKIPMRQLRRAVILPIFHPMVQHPRAISAQRLLAVMGLCLDQVGLH
jgi:hypothetical protein